MSSEEISENASESAVLAFEINSELERAAALGIMVIAFVREPRKPKANKYKQYLFRENDGKILERNIHVSGGGLSIMVAGNPSVKQIITYKSDK